MQYALLRFVASRNIDFSFGYNYLPEAFYIVYLYDILICN